MLKSCVGVLKSCVGSVHRVSELEVGNVLHHLHQHACQQSPKAALEVLLTREKPPDGDQLCHRVLDSVLQPYTHYNRPDAAASQQARQPHAFHEEMSWPPVLVLSGCSDEHDSEGDEPAALPEVSANPHRNALLCRTGR